MVRIANPDAPSLRHGRFEIDKMIGCGGMGIVFKARDPRLDRDVALKLWNLEGEQAEAALVNEAQCQAKVIHPNVATIYETGKIGADVYLAMEYVQGSDGRRWMNEGRGSWQASLALFVCAGQGLAAVHARGLVHADFKPENLLIGDDGRVLVTDFGVARALREAEPGGDDGLGTRVYMAPERLDGRGGDARADQFSFCVSLWECMYGARPFSGETREQLLASMRAGELRTGAELPGVPRRLRRILLIGLAMDPAARFESVEALLNAIADVQVARMRRLRLVVAGVGLLGAGLLGASLGARGAVPTGSRVLPQVEVGITTGVVPTNQVETSSTPALKERALAQVGDGISTGSAPTNQERTELLSEAEILEMIAAGSFADALTAWRHRQYDAWTLGQSSELLSLKVAQAYLERAEELEAVTPSAALLLARYTLQVAASVPLEIDATLQGTASAETMLAKAASLVMKLSGDEHPVRDQSKHSTVPSTLE